MKLSKILLTFALLFCIVTNAQRKELKTQSLSEGTIENQFDYLIIKSDRYKEFKVVKSFWLTNLKKSVGDSLIKMRKELHTKSDVINQKQKQIDKLTISLSDTKKSVENLNKEKSSINFFGAKISKALYNSILWFLIVALIAALSYFVFKFYHSNIVTKETQTKFSDLEREFEGFRHRSLEREQQLRRKLQDEIIKQRKD